MNWVAIVYSPLPHQLFVVNYFDSYFLKGFLEISYKKHCYNIKLIY